MRLKVRNAADLLAGTLFVGVGGAFLVAARAYEFGSPLRMGPGFFPSVLAGLLVAIGALVLLRSLVLVGEPIEGFAWRPLALVTASAIMFGLLVEGAGILAAVAAATFIAARGSALFNWRKTAVMALGLAFFAAAAFVKGLGVAMPILGSWVGG